MLSVGIKTKTKYTLGFKEVHASFTIAKYDCYSSPKLSVGPQPVLNQNIRKYIL